MSWYPGRDVEELREATPPALPSRGAALAASVGGLRRGAAELRSLVDWLWPDFDAATLARGSATILLLVAGGMNSNLIPAYWRSPIYQFLFLAISTVQILGSGALFLGPSPRIYRLAIPATAFLMGFYVITRFIEMPFAPKPSPEHLIGSQLLRVQWVQAAFILACLYVLRSGAAEFRVPLPSQAIRTWAQSIGLVAVRGVAVLAIWGAAAAHLVAAIEHDRLHGVPGVALTAELELLGLSVHQIAFLMMAAGESLIGLVIAWRPPRFLYYLGIPGATMLIVLSALIGLPLFDPESGRPLGLAVLALELSFALCLVYLIRRGREKPQPVPEAVALPEEESLETFEEYEPPTPQQPYAGGTPSRMVAPSYLSYAQSTPAPPGPRPSAGNLLSMLTVMAISGAYLAVVTRPWLLSVPLQQMYMQSGTSPYESVQLAQWITGGGLLFVGVLLASMWWVLVTRAFRGAP